jgi:hypothetical protein
VFEISLNRDFFDLAVFGQEEMYNQPCFSRKLTIAYKKAAFDVLSKAAAA